MSETNVLYKLRNSLKYVHIRVLVNKHFSVVAARAGGWSISNSSFSRPRKFLYTHPIRPNSPNLWL